jgi:XTP/dITP diphosphohydrolase
MKLLLNNLEKKSDRSARFRTVIALIYQGDEYLFEGICEGEIVAERHGTEGFGYDPVFRPKGYDRCFAEMTADEKNAISHRGRATQKLAEFLKDK